MDLKKDLFTDMCSMVCCLTGNDQSDLAELIGYTCCKS